MVKSAPNPAPAWTNDYIPALTKEIINGQHILHVSFLTKDSEYPTVCYLVGQILKYKSNPEVLYVHGHVQEPVLGRLKGLEKGDLDLSVSIAASTIHSHYLGFSGFATGFAFADTVLNGTASLIGVCKETHDERAWVMKEFVNAQVRGRWDNIRPIGTDVDYVTLIKITPNAQKSHTHSVLQVFARPYPVNDGDIVQLGIDFKGGEEMIFRCVKIRVELNKGWQTGPSSFNVQSHKRLRELNNNQKKPSVAGSSASNGSSQDCSICLGAIAPCQSLFVAPCSHTWHYKCIRVVINGPTWPHFICPNCRTVADLEAELDEPDGDWEELAASDEEVDAVPESAADFTTPHDTEPVAEAEEAAVPQAADPTAAPSLPEPETFEASDVHHTEDDLDTSDESSTGPPTHEAGIEGIAFLHVGDSPASSTSATPTPQANNNNSTVPPVDIITRKPVPSASTASSSRVEHIRGSPSPNGIHPVLADPLTGEGPMTPRNDVGPFIFDGGAGRTNGLRLASGVGNLEYNDTPTTAHATPHSAV